MPEDVDAIIIGSGQGGIPLALHLADRGKRVALFERDHFGGSCVNYGCTPSKAFLAAAHGAGRARDAAALGVHCEVRVDQAAAMERVRAVRGEWRDGSAAKLESSKVELVRAEARFTAARTVAGGGRELRAPLVVIDTGTSATIPPIAGIEAVPYLTNVTWWEQLALPKRLVVLGGGYIGLELGQGARRLGCEVTIADAGERVMSEEAPEVSKVLRAALEADGVRFELGARAVSASYDGATVALVLESGTTLEGDALLVAAGRTPNTKALDCAKSGIELEPNGMVRVDEFLHTTCEGVYALGDVAGQPAFTHVSWEDYRRLVSTLAGTPRRRDDRVLSYAAFTEPQLGRTGLSESQAKGLGIAAKSATVQLSDVARGTEWNLERGYFTIVIDTASDRIVGATFVGYEAGELIHVITALVEMRATWQDLDRQMYVHPTFAEGLPGLARQFEAE